jgi:hypothetical protein
MSDSEDRRPHYLAGIKDPDSARKNVAVATLFGACNSDAVREGTLALPAANARAVKEITNHQHTDQGESDDESGDHEVMEQSPEDAGYSPPLANTVEGGENLDELFEYTVPDWAMNNRTPN